MDSSQPSLRTACTRCHAQKLRCSGRSETEQTCSRCSKAGLACVFGTSVRGKRPAAVAAEGLRTASDMDKDFTASKRAHRTLSTDTSNQIPQQTSPMMAEWNPPTFDEAEVAEQLLFSMSTSTPIISDAYTTTATDPHGQVVENLTLLNLDLFRRAKTIPPLTSQPPDMSKNHEPFKLDEIFKLTVAFLDVIRSLRLQESSPEWGVVIDAATVFLVLSCWRRLADMYDCLFIHIQRCAEQTVLPAARGGRPVSLPLLSIGSFIPDATMSILLQMIATLHHSTQLASGMSDFAAKMNMEGGSIHSDELTYTDLKCRTDNLHQQIRSIKSKLAQTGLL